LLKKVRIPAAESRVKDFPHQLSGGMRQRAMIAMGLANTPSILIADEPTTALDVTCRPDPGAARDLNRELGTAIVMITHNMGVVAGLCTRVIVMYAGKIVEEGPVEQIFDSPQHPYTWSLLRSIPRVDALATSACGRSRASRRTFCIRPRAAASIRAVRSGSTNASRTSPALSRLPRIREQRAG